MTRESRIQPVRDVFAVVVAFNPEPERLRALCATLESSGTKAIVVDNSEPSVLRNQQPSSSARVISLDTNAGIARAQNVGARAALDSGAEVVIFFDQDSRIDHGLISSLVSTLEAGQPQVVAPVSLDDDEASEELPAERLSRWGTPRPVRGLGQSGPVEVDVVISSGSAVTRSAFDLVGPFDEGLFIDYVDTEWCLRARSRGVPIRVVPQAVMVHRIGSRTVRVGKHRLLVHSPQRCYYQVRNAFLLFRAPHVPKTYVLHQLGSLAASRLVLLFFSNHKSAYVRAYLRGIWDGLTGHRGK